MNRWLAQLLWTDADQKVPVIGPRSHVIGPTPGEQHGSGDRSELLGQYRVFDRRRHMWRVFEGRLVQQGRSIAKTQTAQVEQAIKALG